MIRNGPKIKLKSAPGRRITSTTSLLMKAVVRVQLLSSPSHASQVVRIRLLRSSMSGASHQFGEHFVERGAIFADRGDLDARCLDRLRNAWADRASVVGDDE